MKRRSFLTTAFALFGLGRVAAAPTTPAVRCRALLDELKKSDKQADQNREKLMRLFSPTPSTP